MGIADTIATITLVLMLAIGAIWAFAVLKKSKGDESSEPNYRVFYVGGLILLSIGIIWIGSSFFSDISIGAGGAFLGVGITYLMIGLAYRDKWRK
jgi:hypothetical protein